MGVVSPPNAMASRPAGGASPEALALWDQAKAGSGKQEHEFRGLVEQLNAGLFVLTADGSVAYVNRRFARELGYEPDEIIGRPMLRFVAESKRTAAIERLSAHMAGRQQSSKYASMLLRKDGSLLDVLVDSVVGTYGGQRATIGVLLDVGKRIRMEERLREEEAKFRSVVEQNVAGVAIVRDDGTIAYCNGCLAQMIGYTPEDLVGRAVLDFVPETEQPNLRSLKSQLFATGLPGQIASTVRARDGSLVEVLVNASKSTFEGRPAAIDVVVDVTARNRAQRELTSTAAILAAEHEASPDGILVVNPEGRIISVNRRVAEIFEIPASLYVSGDDEPLLALATQRTADPEGFLRRVRYLYAHPDESSHEEIPLRNGTILERFSAPFKTSDGASPGRIWFFHDITKRRRAEDALRASEECFRMLVEEAPDAISILDCDQGCLIAANRAAEHLFGVSRDKIIGRRPSDFYATMQPDGQPVAESYSDDNQRALAGEEVTYERRIVRPSGDERLCRVTFVRLPSDVRLLRASFVDITEQKAAEQGLLRLNRALTTLSRGNEALVRCASEPELLMEMCRVIVEDGGYRMAWVGVVEHDAAKSVTPVAWAGEIGQYLNRTAITWADEPRGRGPTGRATRTGEPQLSLDLLNDPTMAPWIKEAKRSGFASAIALPLKGASGVFATLNIYSTEPAAFDRDESELLRELAKDLSFGIQSLRERAAHEALNRRWLAGFEATVGAIAGTVEKRDPYTAGHQERVAKLAVAIARELALPEPQVEGLSLAAIIHDVGKIDIPLEILNKPGRLSDLQLGLVRGHAQAGYDIIKGIDFPWPIAQIVLQHHERLDGSGYPQGLKGDAILPEAKILVVADVVEAMMSHRPYRPGLGIDVALAEVERNKGRFYDPAAVEACVGLFRNKGFAFK
jgi:PAS domain S-box-containing protein